MLRRLLGRCFNTEMASHTHVILVTEEDDVEDTFAKVKSPEKRLRKKD